METGQDQAPTFDVSVVHIKPNEQRDRCPFGHQVGGHFEFGAGTPAGLCAEAFVRMFPILHALRAGGDLRALGGSESHRVMHWCPTRIVQFEVVARRWVETSAPQALQAPQPMQPVSAPPPEPEARRFGRKLRPATGRR